MHDCDVIIKSAGEMASGIAVRLHKAGFRRILMLEISEPLAVRRNVSFCEAVYQGSQSVEGVFGRLARDRAGVEHVWLGGDIAVVVDPLWRLVTEFSPVMLVDAIIAKRNLGTTMEDAPVVVALGPGFTAGVDAHCVVETNRGHNLGSIYTHGTAAPNTGIPGPIGGCTLERVLRAKAAGNVQCMRALGDMVTEGEVVFVVDGQETRAAISGVLRGCIRPGLFVPKGAKLGDIDPRGRTAYCHSISEKARALGGSVLEILCAKIAGYESPGLPYMQGDSPRLGQPG